jgi:hypothetical protein
MIKILNIIYPTSMLQPKFKPPAPVMGLVLLVLFSLFSPSSVMLAAGLAWVLFEAANTKLLSQAFHFGNKSILEQTPATFLRPGIEGMHLPIRPFDFTVAAINKRKKSGPGGLVAQRL